MVERYLGKSFYRIILPKLKDEYIIFVDGKKPIGFETQIENFHFHGDDSKCSKKLLEEVMKYTLHAQLSQERTSMKT